MKSILLVFFLFCYIISFGQMMPEPSEKLIGVSEKNSIIQKRNGFYSFGFEKPWEENVYSQFYLRDLQPFYNYLKNVAENNNAKIRFENDEYKFNAWKITRSDRWGDIFLVVFLKEGRYLGQLNIKSDEMDSLFGLN